jgi:tRNA threonylcarbamoyladenosine modification (KEOPS) complex Cgi121 subunit
LAHGFIDGFIVYCGSVGMGFLQIKVKKMKMEYEVYITVIECYKVEAESREEAAALAIRGEAGDAETRRDLEIEVLEA